MKTARSFGLEVRRRRQELHFSQGELAALAGCSQTSISNLESGQRDVLGDQNLEKLCKTLGLELPLAWSLKSILAFCSNSDCPKALRAVVNSRLVVKPTIYKMTAGSTRFCGACGTVLSTTCQEPHCQAPVEPGAAFCSQCSSPMVKVKDMSSIVDLQDLANRLNRNRQEFEEAGRVIIPLENASISDRFDDKTPTQKTS